MALLKGYRLRRGPALALLLAVGVLGALVILAGQLRPQLDLYSAVTVPDGHTGTAYAVDDQVCVRAGQVGATIDRVEVADGPGLALRASLPPEDEPPVIAFPVDPSAGQEVAGTRVPAGESVCLRLLLSSEEQGEYRAPQISVKTRYGPFGLFRRSLEVEPPSTLVVTRPGPDPRLQGQTGSAAS